MKIRIFFRFFIIGRDRRCSGIQEKLDFSRHPRLRRRIARLPLNSSISSRFSLDKS